MARRVIRIERLIAVLGVAVLALGVAIVWLVSRNALTRTEVSPLQRAESQLRTHLNPRVTVVYSEEGRRNALCGYVRTEGRNVAFVSRPNRIILETDPLKSEFDDMQRDLCPGFMTVQNLPAAP
ncbi:hypothetical protein ACIQC9_10065 [Brevundimonas sp. NPDC092305]|uniref:hypothetical protein n=1 Tax=Brevundimonas sp. NPDC092305 TaxID=3363957 RepID=UPI0038006EA1